MKKHSEKTSLLGGEAFFSWCTPDIHFFQQLLDYQAGHLSGWGLPIGQFNWKLSKSQAWQVFRENHGRVLPSRHQCRRIPSLWSWDMDSFPRGYLSFKNLCLHINEIYHDLSIPSNSSCFYLHQLMAMCFFELRWGEHGITWLSLRVYRSWDHWIRQAMSYFRSMWLLRYAKMMSKKTAINSNKQ